jgi:hypothetical protein
LHKKLAMRSISDDNIRVPSISWMVLWFSINFAVLVKWSSIGSISDGPAVL